MLPELLEFDPKSYENLIGAF